MLKYCSVLLMLLGLVACATDPEPADFMPEELRDLTPIMQFKGNPIPEECYDGEHVTTNITENTGKTFWRMYCHFYYENYSELYSAIEEMGWEYDEEEGVRGDCGPKHEYARTVGHRKLHLYVKTCDEEELFVSENRFLFHVEYN